MTDDTRVTGTDLKVARTRLRVRGVDLAKVLGVSSSRLSRIEGPERVTDRMARRYFDALETCRTSGTEG